MTTTGLVHSDMECWMGPAANNVSTLEPRPLVWRSEIEKSMLNYIRAT